MPRCLRFGIWITLLLTLLFIPACGPGENKQYGTLPDIFLPDLRGKAVNLRSYKGKVVLLNFWASWCAPCRMEIPDFIILQHEYKKRGFTIVGISMDQKGRDLVAEFSHAMKINYPVLYAGKRRREIVDLVGGFRGIPTSFLVDRKGRLVLKHTGLAPITSWKKHIEKLL